MNTPDQICYCWYNGKIIPSTEATVSIHDLGFIRSYAVFDYFRTYNGKPFRIEDHYKRFTKSAKELNLTVALSLEELKTTVEFLLEKSKLHEAGVRLILTGGLSSDGMAVENPNFLINIESLPKYKPEIFKQGVKLITYEYLKKHADIKSTNYFVAIKMNPLKVEKGAFDVLYYKGDRVLEGTRNNFFIFKGDTLITPDKDILKGITRKTILELAAKRYRTEERKVLMSELSTADEAFISGSSKMIVPVVEIDDNKIGEGTPGKRTKQLLEDFKTLVSS